MADEDDVVVLPAARLSTPLPIEDTVAATAAYAAGPRQANARFEIRKWRRRTSWRRLCACKAAVLPRP